MNNGRNYVVTQVLDGYKPAIIALEPSRPNPGKFIGRIIALSASIACIISLSYPDAPFGMPLFFLGTLGWGLFPYGPDKMYEKKYILSEMSLLPKKQDDEKYLFIDQVSIKTEENYLTRNYYENLEDYQQGKQMYGNSSGKKLNYENSIFTNDLNKLLIK